MKEYLRLIDTDTAGPRCDVTPLFTRPAAFAQLITDLSEPFTVNLPNYVAGIDALGFVLGTAVALQLNKGFIPIRKQGKLPVTTDTVEFVNYTGRQKELELRRGALKAGEQVLLVDEWIETGAQMQAAITLIEQAGGIVMGITTIRMEDNPLPQRLRHTYHCHVIWPGD
jgi:adenine phosphoribosyltransferase